MKKPRLLGVVPAILLLVGVLMPVKMVYAANGSSDPMSRKERQALFLRGAELWPIYCNTCHNARPGSEFSPVEWNMIIMHMRTQANLPAKDAQAILEYLKASR